MFCSTALIWVMIIAENNHLILHEYLPDLNSFVKQTFIPEEFEGIRSSNDLAKSKLHKISSDLNSIKAQRDVLQQEVETLRRLVESEAYNVKPSKKQLLEQAIMEEKLFKDKTNHGPDFIQFCTSGFVAFVLLKSIILLNIGWDSNPRTR